MKTQKLSRQSLNGIEYQVEYTQAPTSTVCEYRVRRGACGGYTSWVKTTKMTAVINNLGFSAKKIPTAVNDFAFEALLGRGLITLSREVVSKLATTAGTSDLSRHVYSRIKKGEGDTWTLPARAITDQYVFNYVKKLITANT